MFVIYQHPKELPLIQQWHDGITLASFFHMLFLVIKIRLRQVRRSAFLFQHKDQGGKQFKSYFAEGRFPTFYRVWPPNFCWDKPPDSQFFLAPNACSISYTLTSINTMLLKVGQFKFYMICALAFTRYSLLSSKMENCQPLVGF